MAADPPKPSSADPHAAGPASPVPLPAPARGRRLPLATVGILVALGLNLALCHRLRSGAHDHAFVGLSHLNLLLLFLSLRRFERSPPGSPAQGRARLSVWLLAATLAAAFTWKVVGAMIPWDSSPKFVLCSRRTCLMYDDFDLSLG